MSDNIEYGAFADLITEKTTFGLGKLPGERRFMGPCPVCGGQHRTSYFLPTENNPLGSFYCFACNAKGSGVKYLSLAKGISLAEAYTFFEANDPFEFTMFAGNNSTITKPERQNSKWQQQAKLIMDDSREWLLKTPQCQKFYTKRGFTIESIKKYPFGFHNPKSYKYEDFGLTTVNDNEPSFVLEQGLIIMNTDEYDNPLSLRVRLTNPSYDKYQIVTGSVLTSIVPNRAHWNDRLPTLLVEGDLDAYIIDQEAGSIVNVVGIGGGARKISSFVKNKLDIAPFILLGFDNDEAGDQYTTEFMNKYEAAIPLHMPNGLNDPNDLVLAGVDIKAWVYTAIPNKFRKFFLMNNLPEIPKDQYPTIEEKHQVLYAKPNSVSVEEVISKLASMPSKTPVIIIFIDSDCAILYEPSMGKVTVPIEGANFSTCSNIQFVTHNAYRDAKQLSSVGITNPESLELLHAITNHKLRATNYDVVSMYDVFQLYKKDMMLFANVGKYYILLKNAQPYLTNMTPLRIDVKRWDKIIPMLTPAEARKWNNNRRNFGLSGTFSFNLRPHASDIGRFSSVSPAMHSTPKLLRKALVADDGKLLISADFHTLHPKIMASMAKDKEFVNLFNDGRDYYRACASIIFNRPEEEINDDLRTAVKRAVISWGYGSGKKKMLSTIVDDLGCDDPEIIERITAGINAFYNKFPRVSQWKKFLIDQVNIKGSVPSASGRLIPVPSDKIYSSAFFSCCATEVEIMLKAIVTLGRDYAENLPTAAIKGFLHDELLVEASEVDLEQAKTMLIKALTDAFTTTLPNAPTDNLLGIKIGKGWGGDDI